MPDPDSANAPVPPSGSDPTVTMAHMPASAETLDPRARLGARFGNHQLTGILGQGGMGVVYEARDVVLGRKVALKMLPAGPHGGRLAPRFLQEARAVARLSHPNVVGIHDVGQDSGESFLVMEYVDGPSLAEILEGGERPDWAEATRIIAEACRGLAAAHESGLIHRDIKPANILRGRDGRVKLTDFGLAKLAEGLNPNLTTTGNVVGTPAFMSPEHCHAEPIDARSDIYSMGATYFALLSGRGPYADSASTPKIMFAHCYEPVPDPRGVDPTIPEGCAAIVARAMAKDPGDRYPSAAAMLADLELLLGGGTPGASGVAAAALPVPPSTSPTLPTRGLTATTPAPAPISRRRWAVGAAGLAVAAVAAPAAFVLARRAGKRGGPPDRPAPKSPDLAAAVPSGPPIRVGLLHSLSGTMAASESTVVDGTLLAIEELNRGGGILGRRVEPVIADGMSDPAVFAREAERLIRRMEVCTVFGCWTSASRKTVRPIFEKYDHLLIYPVQYEGLEQSPNIVYTGATPNQQILPAIKWAYTDLGRKYFLVGSDYVFPRVAHAIIRDQVAALGGQVVGEEYRPLGSPDWAEVVAAIQASRPDLIVNTINGDSNAAFFRALRRAKITSTSIPTLSFSIAENEVRSLGAPMMAGDYAAWNYFESLDRPANHAFLARFREKFGPQRLTSDPTEAAYFGVHLWARAVKAAGSIATPAIRRALLGQSFEAPEGPVRVDPRTQHTWKIARIGKITEDGAFDVFWSSARPIAPEPFPASRPRADWEALLADLQGRWGGGWEAPEGS